MVRGAAECFRTGCASSSMHHPGSSVEIAPYALPHEVFAVPIAVDLTGKQFGRLTVLRLSGHNIHRQREWLCRCACGTELVLPSVRFRTGNTSSCGCLKREVNRLLNLSHGASGGANAGYAQFPGAYKSWLAMRARCLNPGAVQYHHYGGRGITVHPRWLASYEAFLADMGERPAGTSLDRINPNRNYEPGNCRWATRAEQART